MSSNKWSRRIKTFIIAIAISFCAANSFAAADIIFKPDKLMEITYDGKKSQVDLSSKVNAAGQLKGKIVFSNYKNNYLYLLIDIFGPSKLSGGPGYCGAGEEYNLVWIIFDNQLKPSNMESTLYDSCLESVAIDPPHDDDSKPRYQIQNNTIGLKYISFRNKIKYSFYYDNNKAESGFTISTSPFNLPK